MKPWEAAMLKRWTRELHSIITRNVINSICRAPTFSLQVEILLTIILDIFWPYFSDIYFSYNVIIFRSFVGNVEVNRFGQCFESQQNYHIYYGTKAFDLETWIQFCIPVWGFHQFICIKRSSPLTNARTLYNWFGLQLSKTIHIQVNDIHI